MLVKCMDGIRQSALQQSIRQKQMDKLIHNVRKGDIPKEQEGNTE